MAENADSFFDDSFLAELQELAGPASPHEAKGAPLHEKLARFLEDPREGAAGPLTEESFLELPEAELAESTNRLLAACRGGPHPAASQAAENFIVFFQALVPTLGPEGAGQVKRFFFRLAATLLQIAHHDAGGALAIAEGRSALTNLETILIEISDVRLAPGESELVFRSLDQLAGFIAVGEFTVASRIVSAQLLDIIERNKQARALYRLMEAEAVIQEYLRAKLGRRTSLLCVPEDLAALAEYGPLRILEEETFGVRQRLIQVQIPGLTALSDVVLCLSTGSAGAEERCRLDALGSAELTIPDGSYVFGLAYEPIGLGRSRRAAPPPLEG